MRNFCLVLSFCAVSCGRIGFETGAPDADTRGAGDLVDSSPGLSDAASALRLLAPGSRVNYNTTIQLVASGGQPPYSYQRVSGGGVLDAQSGVYRSAGASETAVLRVVDRVGTQADLSLVTGGDALYFLSGRVGLDPSTGYVDTIWRSADGGAQWQLIGNMPAPLYNGAALVVDDAIWYLGGRAGNSAWHSEVWRSTDGVNWTVVGNMPAPRAAAATAYFQGRFWVVGGFNNGDTQTVFSSPDGMAWTVEPEFPFRSYGAVAVVAGSEFRFMGSGLAGRDVWTTNNGAVWAATANVVPVACTFARTTRLGNSHYYGGGIGCQNLMMRSDDDGLNWTTVGAIPNMEGPAFTVLGDRLVLAGGTTDLVQTSLDGITWTTVGRLPATRNGGRMVAFTPAP